MLYFCCNQHLQQFFFSKTGNKLLAFSFHIASKFQLKTHNPKLLYGQILQNYILLLFFIIFMTLPQQTSTKVQPSAQQINPAVAKLNEKKKAEFYWKIILIVASVISAILTKNMYIFQTHQYFENIRKGHTIDLLCGIFIGFGFYMLESYLKSKLNNFVTNQWIRKDRYIDPESRKRRVQLMSKWIYTIPYYLVNTCIAYYLLKDTDVLPVWLGGSGRCANLYLHIPYVAAEPFGIRIFYLVAFGKSLSHCIVHLFIRPEGNYYEYALHHGITTFLIVFSYLMNFWTAGVFILMIHDLSDASLALARLYSDYKYRRNWVLQCIYVYTGITWTGCRIFIHASCCVFPIYQAYVHLVSNLNPFQIQVMEYPGLFMGSLVVVLEILHVFWTYFILSVWVVTSFDKKAKISVYES